MTRESDQDYYRRRQRAEIELANATRDPAAAQVHRTLAEHYAIRCSDQDAARPTLSLVHG